MVNPACLSTKRNSRLGLSRNYVDGGDGAGTELSESGSMRISIFFTIRMTKPMRYLTIRKHFSLLSDLSLIILIEKGSCNVISRLP